VRPATGLEFRELRALPAERFSILLRAGIFAGTDAAESGDLDRCVAEWSETRRAKLPCES